MENNKQMISHHNNLTESYFSANELELNIFITILFKSKFKSDNEIILDYKFIKQHFNSKDTSYKTFEKNIRELQGKTMFFKLEDNKYRSISPFPTLDFDRKKKEIYVRVNKDLLPLVTQLKNNFTKYSLLEFIELKSKYSKRIYQLLMQYKKIGKRTIIIEELKKYLDCNTTSYEVFAEFNRVVLKKSINEINKKTDLKIDYKIIRKMTETSLRPVAHEIEFKFKYKEEKEEEIQGIDKLEKAIEKSKRNIHASRSWNKRVDNKIIDIVKKNGEDHAIKVLNNLYINLKKDINTSLVQYINGILKNMEKDEIEDAVIVKEPKKKQVKKVVGKEGKNTEIDKKQTREEIIKEFLDGYKKDNVKEFNKYEKGSLNMKLKENGCEEIE